MIFFTALGAVYTPMEYQPILNQTLIPFTMLSSYLFLGKRYYLVALLGAALIFAGATTSLAPALITGESKATSNYRWYSCVIYMFSNVPMALSAVYKEHAFQGRRSVNVWYLCFWVSFYQFLVSFLFIPFLALPFIGGSDTATPLSELPKQFANGFNCWLGQDPNCVCNSYWVHLPATSPPSSSGIACPFGPPLLLIPLYTLVNFLFNGAGLIMTKYGSAVLRYISYAMILPITTIFGSLILKEKVGIYTYIGLVIVLVGFGLFQSYGQTRKYTSLSVGDDLEDMTQDLFKTIDEDGNNYNQTNRGLESFDKTVMRPEATPLSPPISIQSSFQERVVGMDFAHKSLIPNKAKSFGGGIFSKRLEAGEHFFSSKDNNERRLWNSSL